MRAELLSRPSIFRTTNAEQPGSAVVVGSFALIAAKNRQHLISGTSSSPGSNCLSVAACRESGTPSDRPAAPSRFDSRRGRPRGRGSLPILRGRSETAPILRTPR
jgi:hypothetical protein